MVIRCYVSLDPKTFGVLAEFHRNNVARSREELGSVLDVDGRYVTITRHHRNRASYGAGTAASISTCSEDQREAVVFSDLAASSSSLSSAEDQREAVIFSDVAASVYSNTDRESLGSMDTREGEGEVDTSMQQSSLIDSKTDAESVGSVETRGSEGEIDTPMQQSSSTINTESHGSVETREGEGEADTSVQVFGEEEKTDLEIQVC